MSRPVLFLDFDGVLNSARFLYSRPRERPAGISDYERAMDPKAIEILNYVVDKSGAHVVVSSAWRKGAPVKNLRHGLRSVGFRGNVIGKTPDLTGWSPRGLYVAIERGKEIQHWLDHHRAPTAFAIVDDDADMAHLRHRLVKTDFETGLTWEHSRELVRLLDEGKSR